MMSRYTNTIVLSLMVASVFAINNRPVKRSFGYSGFAPVEWTPNNGFGGFNQGAPWAQVKQFPPTPAEITTAIAGAKQASANVLIAQQQVQAEKENVLQQQKIATEKENLANIAKQKNDIFSAVQRSEAAAAAQAVVLAQQRLAAAKTAVAHQQRMAAHKEANAAAAIQSAAHAAATEIQRTEDLATKLSNLQRNDNAALSHHVAATKDDIVGPLSSGLNHSPNLGRLLLSAPSHFGAPWSNGGTAGHTNPWAFQPTGGNFYFPTKQIYNPWN